MVKITLTSSRDDMLSVVSNALISLDIINKNAVECCLAPDCHDLRLDIHGEGREVITAKSYGLPLRLGRLLDDAAMVVSGAHAAPRLAIGDYMLDTAHNMLHFGEKEIRLTDRENEILVYLNSAAPRIVARKELLEKIWGYVDGVETHTLETHIYRLRQKIASLGGPDLLLTEEPGYCLNL